MSQGFGILMGKRTMNMQNVGSILMTESKGTILIIDDEPSIRRVLLEFLVSKGFKALSASFAEEALAILSEIKVDIVITNLRMPGMGGEELTKLIKERYDSQVIIMTGYHSFKYDDAVRAGASDLLHKPAKLQDLMESINRIKNS